MVKPVRWGILGAAKFAREHMGPAIHAAEGAVLSVLGTSTPQKAAPFRALVPDLRVHDGYAAVLADPDVDAVYVPLPNHLHVDWAIRALEAGKPVLVEKPVAMDVAEADRLIAARDATGLAAAEAYMIVHHPQWQRVRTLLADGAVGELVQVDGCFTYDNRADPGNIRNRPETGGGGLRDIGVYPIGAARWATGQEPETLAADIVAENGVDVQTRVEARFPGFRFRMLVSTRMMRWQEMTFHGTAGLLRLAAPFNPVSYGEARLDLHRLDGSVVVERFPAARQYVAQVEAFGAHLRTGAPWPWPLEQARGTQAVIDRILAAG